MFGDQCRLFVVGDLKQSIYRFRGASLSAFTKVLNTKNIGEWEEHSLNRNYRTDRRLLDCFHYIFSDMGTEKLLPYEEEKDRLRSRVKKEYEDDELIEKIDIHSKKKEGFYDDLFKAVNVQIEKLTRLNRTQKLSPEEQKIAILVRYNWQISNIV